MDEVMKERRRAGAQAGNLQQKVSAALALQRQVGTVAAVEHLKMAGAQGTLISRVLRGEAVRAGDRVPQRNNSGAAA
jgi:hypothetical protein